MSCTPSKEDGTNDTQGSQQGVTDEFEDSGVTSPPPEDATLKINIAIDVGWISASSEEGETQSIGGPYYPDDILYSFVDPGTWWVTAYDADYIYCNVSETQTIGAGETLEWDLMALPGTTTKDGGCIFR